MSLFFCPVVADGRSSPTSILRSPPVRERWELHYPGIPTKCVTRTLNGPFRFAVEDNNGVPARNKPSNYPKALNNLIVTYETVQSADCASPICRISKIMPNLPLHSDGSVLNRSKEGIPKRITFHLWFWINLTTASIIGLLLCKDTKETIEVK